MKRYLPFLLLLTACPGKTLVTPPTPIQIPEHESNIEANPPPAPLQTPQVTSSVWLCWDRSPDPTVTSYGLYQDGNQVQEVTTNQAQVFNLNPGQMYLFFVTAKAPGQNPGDAEDESGPSNKIKYIVPVLSIDQLGVHFTVPETNYVSNQSYDLLTTTNLADTNSWTTNSYSVDSTGTNALGTVDFSSAQRFFRLRVNFGGASCEGEKK